MLKLAVNRMIVVGRVRAAFQSAPSRPFDDEVPMTVLQPSCPGRLRTWTE